MGNRPKGMEELAGSVYVAVFSQDLEKDEMLVALKKIRFRLIEKAPAKRFKLSVIVQEI